jgi:hypothetical protein
VQPPGGEFSSLFDGLRERNVRLYGLALTRLARLLQGVLAAFLGECFRKIPAFLGGRGIRTSGRVTLKTGGLRETDSCCVVATAGFSAAGPPFRTFLLNAGSVVCTGRQLEETICNILIAFKQSIKRARSGVLCGWILQGIQFVISLSALAGR